MLLFGGSPKLLGALFREGCAQYMQVQGSGCQVQERKLCNCVLIKIRGQCIAQVKYSPRLLNCSLCLPALPVSPRSELLKSSFQEVNESQSHPSQACSF